MDTILGFEHHYTKSVEGRVGKRGWQSVAWNEEALEPKQLDQLEAKCIQTSSSPSRERPEVGFTKVGDLYVLSLVERIDPIPEDPRPNYYFRNMAFQASELEGLDYPIPDLIANAIGKFSFVQKTGDRSERLIEDKNILISESDSANCNRNEATLGQALETMLMANRTIPTHIRLGEGDTGHLKVLEFLRFIWPAIPLNNRKDITFRYPVDDPSKYPELWAVLFFDEEFSSGFGRPTGHGRPPHLAQLHQVDARFKLCPYVMECIQLLINGKVRETREKSEKFDTARNGFDPRQQHQMEDARKAIEAYESDSGDSKKFMRIIPRLSKAIQKVEPDICREEAVKFCALEWPEFEREKEFKQLTRLLEVYERRVGEDIVTGPCLEMWSERASALLGMCLEIEDDDWESYKSFFRYLTGLQAKEEQGPAFPVNEVRENAITRNKQFLKHAELSKWDQMADVYLDMISTEEDLDTRFSYNADYLCLFASNEHASGPVNELSARLQAELTSDLFQKQFLRLIGCFIDVSQHFPKTAKELLKKLSPYEWPAIQDSKTASAVMKLLVACPNDEAAVRTKAKEGINEFANTALCLKTSANVQRLHLVNFIDSKHDSSGYNIVKSSRKKTLEDFWDSFVELVASDLLNVFEELSSADSEHASRLANLSILNNFNAFPDGSSFLFSIPSRYKGDDLDTWDTESEKLFKQIGKQIPDASESDRLDLLHGLSPLSTSCPEIGLNLLNEICTIYINNEIDIQGFEDSKTYELFTSLCLPVDFRYPEIGKAWQLLTQQRAKNCWLKWDEYERHWRDILDKRDGANVLVVGQTIRAMREDLLTLWKRDKEISGVPENVMNIGCRLHNNAPDDFYSPVKFVFNLIYRGNISEDSTCWEPIIDRIRNLLSSCEQEHIKYLFSELGINWILLKRIKEHLPNVAVFRQAANFEGDTGELIEVFEGYTRCIRQLLPDPDLATAWQDNFVHVTAWLFPQIAASGNKNKEIREKCSVGWKRMWENLEKKSKERFPSKDASFKALDRTKVQWSKLSPDSKWKEAETAVRLALRVNAKVSDERQSLFVTKELLKTYPGRPDENVQREMINSLSLYWRAGSERRQSSDWFINEFRSELSEIRERTHSNLYAELLKATVFADRYCFYSTGNFQAIDERYLEMVKDVLDEFLPKVSPSDEKIIINAFVTSTKNAFSELFHRGRERNDFSEYLKWFNSTVSVAKRVVPSRNADLGGDKAYLSLLAQIRIDLLKLCNAVDTKLKAITHCLCEACKCLMNHNVDALDFLLGIIANYWGPDEPSQYSRILEIVKQYTESCSFNVEPDKPNQEIARILHYLELARLKRPQFAKACIQCFYPVVDWQKTCLEYESFLKLSNLICKSKDLPTPDEIDRMGIRCLIYTAIPTQKYLWREKDYLRIVKFWEQLVYICEYATGEIDIIGFLKHSLSDLKKQWHNCKKGGERDVLKNTAKAGKYAIEVYERVNQTSAKNYTVELQEINIEFRKRRKPESAGQSSPEEFPPKQANPNAPISAWASHMPDFGSVKLCVFSLILVALVALTVIFTRL